MMVSHLKMKEMRRRRESQLRRIKAATKQVRKARDLVHRTHADLEETFNNVSSQISKKRQATTTSWLASLEKVLAQLKASLSKNLTVTQLTKLLEEAANIVKSAKEEKKS